MTNYAIAYLEQIRGQLVADIQEKKLALADVNETLELLTLAPRPPQPQSVPPAAAPVTNETGQAEAVVTPEELTEAPAGIVPDDDTPPWDQQEQAPAAEPTSGRRTNEQIAAEHGVDLKDVKAYAEKKGVKRVTKGLIEEYAKSVREQRSEPFHPDGDRAARGDEPEQVPGQQSIDDFEDGDASAEVYEPPF